MPMTPRVAIVTGAAGGIGKAMVRGLLAAGIRVVAVDRDREPLETLTATSREQGKSVHLLTVQTDLTEDSAAAAITRAAHGKFGRIDILVNNAGIGPGAIRPDSWQRLPKFWEITPDQWRRFCCSSHDGALRADERSRARDDAPGLGSNCQRHH